MSLSILEEESNKGFELRVLLNLKQGCTNTSSFVGSTTATGRLPHADA